MTYNYSLRINHIHNSIEFVSFYLKCIRIYKANRQYSHAYAWSKVTNHKQQFCTTYLLTQKCLYSCTSLFQEYSSTVSLPLRAWGKKFDSLPKLVTQIQTNNYRVKKHFLRFYRCPYPYHNFKSRKFFFRLIFADFL